MTQMVTNDEVGEERLETGNLELWRGEADGKRSSVKSAKVASKVNGERHL
jgi:hypothetical protein